MEVVPTMPHELTWSKQGHKRKTALFTDTLNSANADRTQSQTGFTERTHPSCSQQTRKRTTKAKRVCFTSGFSSDESISRHAVTQLAPPCSDPLREANSAHPRTRARNTNQAPSYDTNRDNRVPRVTGKKPPRFQVTLRDVTSDVMYQLLEHVYGGHVTLTDENVQSILTAADRFQVTLLVRECCNFLSDKLSTQNCISLLLLSSNFIDCTTLKQKARQFLLDNFETVYKTSPEFTHLPACELCGFLADESLNVRQEENVLDAIIRWVAADWTNREAEIPLLVQCARVGIFFLDPSSQERFNNGICCEATAKVMKEVVRRQQTMMADSDFTMFTPRLPHDVMFVIGGSNFGYPLGIVEAFDSRTWSWLNIGAYDFAPRSYHGVAHVDKYIYIVGGFDGQSYLSSCCRFCPDTLIMSWESVTPMHTKRCYVSVTQYQGAIYAMGGYDGVYRLNSAEKFDPATNQWSFISPMTYHRSDAGVAVLDGKIYVCGGFSGSECIRTMEVYDPKKDEWLPQPSMPHGRSGLGVVSYGGCLYAVGGFNGIDSSVRLSSMERYNPATNQWTTLSPMPHPRSNMAVTVMEDILYSIGGYNGERTSAMVECYNFETDSWHQATRLSQSRSALSVCVLSGLSNTASLLGRDVNNKIEDKYDDNEDDDNDGGAEQDRDNNDNDANQDNDDDVVFQI